MRINCLSNVCLLLATMVCLGCDPPLHQGTLSTEVQAGGIHEVLDFHSTDKNLCLCTEKEEHPLQLQSGGASMVFIAAQLLAKGTPYAVKACTTPAAELRAVLQEGDGKYHIEGAKGTILSFVEQIRLPNESVPSYYGRDGFIHPFYSPDGVELTEDYPRGHTHQHGIFHAWTRSLVKGKMIDFWNQQAQLGTVRLVNSAVVGVGPVYADLQAELEYLAYVDGDTLVAAKESWNLRVYQEAAGRHMADLSIAHTPQIDSLILTEYHYGGFGFRANDSWNLEGSDRSPFDSIAYVLTSEGKDHSNANHSRPEWVAMWGEIEGKTAGIAIASHPTNFRHPQPVRVHPSMPYFTFAPMVLGQFVLTPENVYEARYRMISYDGEVNSTLIDGLTDNFAGE